MYGPFDSWRLQSELRPYQRLAAEAFERDRSTGVRQTHIVAPPGAGKTVVGLELIRRLNVPALVLAPTLTIQEQWGGKLAMFTDQPGAYLGSSLRTMTYQALCQTSDPGGELAVVARDHLIAERAAATQVSVAEAAYTVNSFEGAALTRFTRSVSAEVARMKKNLMADGGAEDLLSVGARERIAELRAAGVRTVVLDECHHLASSWGYLVRAAIAQLGDVHVIGLTATSPSELSGPEAALYNGMLGGVDFEIPTPAVVKDGYLAPYQELAYFTTPLDSEKEWLEAKHTRFAEMIDMLHNPPAPGEEDIAFSPWVIGRIRYRDTGDGSAQIPFSTLYSQRPELAQAGIRYLHDAGLEMPDDAPRGEGWREAPTLDDWLVLIGDYTVGCLHTSSLPAAERRFEELQIALRDLGFTLTAKGVRRGGSDVDQVLTSSASKPLAAIEILACEAESRGDGIRALVLCDTEQGEKKPDDSPLALTGGARGVMNAFAADERTASLHPLLVTGKTLACLPFDVERFSELLHVTVIERTTDLVFLQASGQSALATYALMTGASNLVIGTRGLLGEGWDAPSVNVLVDMTTVAADVSVRQMRGRSIRLNPNEPEKVASNWDVVCLASDLARGSADYSRFVRRHSHVHAPCEDGAIETGVSHVHGLLSPYTPPEEAVFAGLNADGMARAADGIGARSRWHLGETYTGEDIPVILVRMSSDDVRPMAIEKSWWQTRLPKPTGPLVPFRRKALERAYPQVLPLDRLVECIVTALVSAKEMQQDVADSLELTPRAGGVIRCWLPNGNLNANQLLADALDDVLNPDFSRRYLVSRPVYTDKPGHVFWESITGGEPLDVDWHPVPSIFANTKARAEAYSSVWQTFMGVGDLVFAGRHDAAGKPILAETVAEDQPYMTSKRVLWH